MSRRDVVDRLSAAAYLNSSQRARGFVRRDALIELRDLRAECERLRELRNDLATTLRGALTAFDWHARTSDPCVDELREKAADLIECVRCENEAERIEQESRNA